MRTILGYGASTMAGTGDPEGGFFRRLAIALPDRRFVNLGVGGNATADMLARVGQIEPHRPFRTLVLLGCNDLPRDRDAWPQNRVDLATYAANLDALLAKLQGEDGSIFVSSFPPDPGRSGVAIETMDAYMGEALRLAKQHGYQVWDLYHELRQSPKLKEYWAADGLHFNGEGHRLLAERIATLL